MQDALTKTMQRLKLYRETPETGLVIFSGALPTNGPGSEVIRLNEIVPPKPVTTFLYMCDDHFHVEYLKDMLKAEKVYGILALDSNEVGIGILSGDRLDVEDVMTSGISGKTRKGGQSARRYETGTGDGAHLLLQQGLRARHQDIHNGPQGQRDNRGWSRARPRTTS